MTLPSIGKDTFWTSSLLGLELELELELELPKALIEAADNRSKAVFTPSLRVTFRAS